MQPWNCPTSVPNFYAKQAFLCMFEMLFFILGLSISKTEIRIQNKKLSDPSILPEKKILLAISFVKSCWRSPWSNPVGDLLCQINYSIFRNNINYIYNGSLAFTSLLAEESDKFTKSCLKFTFVLKLCLMCNFQSPFYY